MSNAAIQIENLGKLYKLGEISTGTLSHDLNRWWARVRGKEDPYAKVGKVNDRTVSGSNDYIWALKNIDINIRQGEVLGIIGRNGAGKSTLLKILSKVTTPTEGNIKIKGRVASLLEVGTGFHPELTGKENIFLNGAILGMTRNEIRKKFDEIVEFAGVERYIDTPVKRYSSGMYVRLAFAVAAHLESEILIVDEVLAVGDAEFQRKCLGKMKDVNSQQGRTVLFVSHNLSQVHNFCQRGILLNNGQLVFDGDVSKAITNYVHGNLMEREVDLSDLPRAGHAIDGFTFTKLVIEEPKENIYEKDLLKLKIGYQVSQPLEEVVVGFTISDAFQTLVECRSGDKYPHLCLKPGDQGFIEVSVPLQLAAGSYSINIGARYIGGLLEYIPSAASIEILPDPNDATEQWKKSSAGAVITTSEWNMINPN